MDRHVHVGAVLVGGRSSRMGTPKHAMLMPDGRTMLQHVAATLSQVARQVVAVGSRSIARDVGYPHIEDLRPDLGPLGGIEALLAAANGGTLNGSEQFIICPCDLPLISAQTLELLTQSSEALATVFRIEGCDVVQPMPARLSAQVLPVVRRLLNSHQRSMAGLIAELNPHIVTLPAALLCQLHNVNERADYEEAVRLLSDSPG